MPRPPPKAKLLSAYHQLLGEIAAARIAKDSIQSASEASHAQAELWRQGASCSASPLAFTIEGSRRTRGDPVVWKCHARPIEKDEQSQGLPKRVHYDPSESQTSPVCAAENTPEPNSPSPSRARKPSTQPHTPVYSVAELHSMDKECRFAIPSSSRLSDIRSEAVQEMQKAALEAIPCCVCELDREPSLISSVKLTPKLLHNMKQCLGQPRDAKIPSFILAQYDASSIDVRLSGLLLFPPGIKKIGDQVMLQICTSCEKHLMSTKNGQPPVLAIANGNYIGHIPVELELTRTDEQMVALVSPCMSISTVTGGLCRTIKAHHYVVQNTEGPILSMLPRDLTERVRVAMVGSMTPAQVASCRKRYDVDIQRCKQALEFLNANNCEYQKYREEHQNSFFPTTEVLSSETSILIDNTTPGGTNDGSDKHTECARDDSSYSRFASADPINTDSSLELVCEEPSSLLLRKKESKHPEGIDVLVRKSSKYVTKQGWAACVLMFPTLFPGGCGGPTEPRKRRLSFRRWLRRCFEIHGHRFERHYAFMLLAFDQMASESARNALFVKMHVSTVALKAASIANATIRAAIDYHNYLMRIKARGLKPSRPPLDVQRVIELRRGLHIPESAYFGSNLSRMRARHDLFGMLKRFGPLQLFFTVSPDSSGTYSIAIKSGSVSASAVESANVHLLPNRAERRAIAARHPMECARYFVRVMDTVITTFLGWDDKSCRPRQSGGIFGVVRAFVAAAETQVAGDLHAHFVVWLYGFPPTSAKIQRSIELDDDFKHRLLVLADSVLTVKPPCIESDAVCRECDEHPSLSAVLPGVDAFRRPSRGASAPVTAQCSTCGAAFCADDIINEAITALADREHVRISEHTADFVRCRPPNELDSSLILSIIIRDVQVHYWYHSKSCFKVTVQTPKGSVCRFFKPESVHAGPTCIGDDGRLQFHRPVGCEYINPYNPTLLSVLKCNHDVQFVLCSETKNTAAYVCKYCIKKQNQVENVDAVSIAAFAKGANKADMLPATSTAIERGKKILGSMLYTVTNGQEVAAPMAALYILRESPFWFSHNVVRVDFGHWLQPPGLTRQIAIQVDRTKFERAKKKYVAPLNILERYWKRARTIESTSFIDYCERQDAIEYGVDSNNLGCEHYHPRGALKSVVVLCGRELPAIDSHSSAKDKDFYYTVVVSLFKPHRQNTLFQPDKSAFDAYRNFIRSSDSIIVDRIDEFESILRDYNRSSMKDLNAKPTESSEARLLQTRAAPTSIWSPVLVKPVVDQDDDSVADDSMIDDVVDNGALLSTQRLLSDARSSVDSIPSVRATVDETASSYPAVHMEGLPDHVDAEHYPLLVVDATSSTLDTDTMGTHIFIHSFPDTKTRLDRFRECFCPVPWHPLFPPRWNVDSLPAFPAIAMVSEAYQLNFWQHVVFEMFSRHLLYAYSKDIDSALGENEKIYSGPNQPTPYDIKNHLIGYLGGEAGTGKSTVVHALLTFACKWGREGSIETMAFTGVAAINIQGKTMHSARNLTLGMNDRNHGPSTEMKAKFSRVILVIVDEISMTDQSLLGRTDNVSREMSNRHLDCMGGRHTFFLGDWLQLPTVAGSPCFDKPGMRAATTRHAGFALYSAINFVVFLTENMRARLDPVYTRILSELRWGRLSDIDLASLNTRAQCRERLASSSTAQHADYYCPVVVATNNLRCAINRDMTFQVARRLLRPIYECTALASKRSQVILSRILNLNDDLTDRIPIKLLFFIGMPVMVTRKHPDLLQADVIANGVLGTIAGFYPPT